MLFCCEICFVAICAFLCGEKFIQKFSQWRKNDKNQVCPNIPNMEYRDTIMNVIYNLYKIRCLLKYEENETERRGTFVVGIFLQQIALGTR